VEGRLQTRSWDGPDGQRRYRTEVIANTVLFLDRAQAAALTDEQPLPEHEEAPAPVPEHSE
jgi:single-strand DNA-binding protein